MVISGARADLSAVKVFAGGDFSLTGVMWDSEIKDMMKDQDVDLGTMHNGLGAVLGVRYATRNTYNIGASLAYDYMLDSKSKVNRNTVLYDPYNDQYFSYTKFSMGFSAFSATLDLYIRLFKQNYTYNNRGDLVLGVGPARITERGEANKDIVAVGVVNNKSDDYDSGLVVKLGYNGQIDQNWDWFVHGRYFFIPTGGNDIDGLLNLSVGVKYNF